ncbi:iron ABC transporter permease, partial [Cytophagia bacterium CHB2]|nr:iron ABC transporter permease [Cytophagia bacterium CHB2]
MLPRNKTSVLLLGALVAVLALTIYFPLGTMLYESLWVNGRFSFAHFVRFFDVNQPANLQALWGSVKISVLSVLFSAFVGVPLAVLFTRFEFPGRKLFGLFVTLPMLLPPLVGVIAFYFLMGETGIVPRLLQKFLDLSTPPLVMRGVP